MKKRYWLRRQKPASHLISDFSKPNGLDDRYIQHSGIRFVGAPIEEPLPDPDPVEEEVKVFSDCQVVLKGVSCGIEMGEGDVEAVSGNEPTEPLKNKKLVIHRRVIPYVGVLDHDPKYGGLIDPYNGRWGQGKKKD